MKEQNIETCAQPGPEQAARQRQTSQDILKARAEALAQAPGQETLEAIELVTFLLAYESYGIETAWVREVHALKELTPLPCTPPFVIGIVNIRGQVMSVIDIKKFFDLPEKGLTDLNKIIILSDGLMEFGILADAVLEVRSIPKSHIQPPLPTLTGIREQFLQGITAERLIVLDAYRLLTSRNIIIHEEAV